MCGTKGKRMRQIKFRVWWNNEMWYQDRIGSIWFVDGKIQQIDLNNEPFDNSRNGDTWTRSNDFILEQFTGLTDKRGKEIYEGDKVRFRDYSHFLTEGKIVYELDGFYVECGFNGRFSLNVEQHKIEVIGNIHES